ncbi:MAG: hypothetical protein M3361_10550 [Candidatus Tectomicrobia bacterium]|nr:hypothetical protein [Candidatus Tectomicrobia bacterium]
MNAGCAHRWASLLMGTTIRPPGRTSATRSRSRVPDDRLGVCVLVALLLVPAVVRAQPMRWPEAVTALAAGRNLRAAAQTPCG